MLQAIKVGRIQSRKYKYMCSVPWRKEAHTDYSTDIVVGTLDKMFVIS